MHKNLKHKLLFLHGHITLQIKDNNIASSDKKKSLTCEMKCQSVWNYTSIVLSISEALMLDICSFLNQWQ